MRQLAWRSYFAIFTIAFLVGLVMTASGTIAVDSLNEELAFYSLALAEVLALYSFTFSRPMGKPWIWAAVLLLSVTATAFTSIQLLLDSEVRQAWAPFASVFVLLLVLFMLPLWFALAALARPDRSIQTGVAH